ncbi:hypothetical protein RF11_04660 [Thelohanellus kitauei]|uniref:Uncharacterized protein n=1 Tax=Thelohanellus kitauei TaxID=669202 RepID=A0A0C2MXG3_THEKT|nr:hypothetical protein RF11_04660 [Thelohanellus kitauei]
MLQIITHVTALRRCSNIFVIGVDFSYYPSVHMVYIRVYANTDSNTGIILTILSAVFLVVCLIIMIWQRGWCCFASRKPSPVVENPPQVPVCGEYDYVGPSRQMDTTYPPSSYR